MEPNLESSTENRGRDRLVQAATELVAAHGYSGTSVEAITRTAGVTKSALYWHFRSKAELIASALEQTATTWIEDVERAVATTDPADRLLRLLELTRETLVRKSPPVRLLYAVLAERGEDDPVLRRSVGNVFDRLRDSVMVDLSNTYDLPRERFEPLAMVLVSALHGVVFDHLADPDPAWLDRWLVSLQKMVTLMLQEALVPERS